MKNKFALCFRPVIYERTEEINDTNATVAKNIIVCKQKKNINGRVIPLIRRSPVPPRNALSRLDVETISDESTPGGYIGEIKINVESPESDHLEKVKNDHKRKVTSDHDRKVALTYKFPSSSSPDQISRDFQSMEGSLDRSRFDRSYDQNKKTKMTKTNDRASDSPLLSSNYEGDQNVVLYWIVLALLVTIVCGKVFAIVLITFWLYYIRRPSNDLCRLILQPESNSIKLSNGSIQGIYRKSAQKKK